MATTIGGVSESGGSLATIMSGTPRRARSLALFGLTNLCSLILTCTGGLYLAESVTDAVAGTVRSPKTAPQDWYVPYLGDTLVAQDFDIARDFPVRSQLPLTDMGEGASTHVPCAWSHYGPGHFAWRPTSNCLP